MSSQDPPCNPQSVLRDWITLWQSEFAAAAVDREVQEGWARMWAAGREAAGSAGSDAAARPKAAAAASDDESVATLRHELEQLRGRVERLEAGRRKQGRTAPS